VEYSKLGIHNSANYDLYIAGADCISKGIMIPHFLMSLLLKGLTLLFSLSNPLHKNMDNKNTHLFLHLID